MSVTLFPSPDDPKTEPIPLVPVNVDWPPVMPTRAQWEWAVEEIKQLRKENARQKEMLDLLTYDE